MSDLTRQDYVKYVQSLDREQVTMVYADLYREAADIQWPYVDSDGTLKDEATEGEPILLSDDDVWRFAEQDYHDGPDAWAFLDAVRVEG